MARRSGGSNKTVEEKRRNLPIYQHYTLSPGKTKSHHPEAKCNHCLKEFVCGSKQRLIRHLRKCDSISNPDQIIADTLNTLARNSATGQLNHSILEASNLSPSQYPQLQQAATTPISRHSNNNNHHQTIHLHNQQQHPNPNATPTTANNNNNNNNSNSNNLVVGNHNSSATSSAGSNSLNDMVVNGSSRSNMINPNQPQPHKARRGRKPGSTSFNCHSSGIQVTTGIDGKAHFTTISQMSSASSTPINALIPQHNGQNSQTGPNSVALNSHSNHQQSNPSGHLACATTPIPNQTTTNSIITTANNTTNQQQTSFTKLNSENMDKAYLKLVLTRNLPLSLCDTKEFQYWLRMIGNDYKPPTSINLIMLNLSSEAQMASQKISNILVKAPKKTINIELQTWLDEQRGHLWYAILANTDQKRFLISVRDMFQNVYSQTIQSISQDEQQMDTNEIPTLHGSPKPDEAITNFIDELVRRLGSDRINSFIYTSTKESSQRYHMTSRACKNLQSIHPSIVIYDCWWQFTNQLCSDVIEQNDLFQDVMRNSKRLINFIHAKPTLGLNIEKYRPFIGINGSQTKASPRWHSHLVCYLLYYIKNNRHNICKILQALYSISLQEAKSFSMLSSNDNNNNNSITKSSNNLTTTSGDSTGTSTNLHNSQQPPVLNTDTRTLTCRQYKDHELNELYSLIRTNDFWINLDSALIYLKPIQEIVALASLPSITQQINAYNISNSTPPDNLSIITPRVSPTIAANFTLSEYTNWYLNYGKYLLESWRQSPDVYKHQLIARYLTRFNNSFSRFKLLFAAYLLNPKYRCAYMTQKAKVFAIEEILNIASEFMTEESDGLTIFDQWKLYLNREEPYDLAYDENRSTPFEWWMSLPCAESIRRVALRILRLKAFVQPKPESLFQQIYLYEDETNQILNNSSFEEIAILRYYYDHEDKIGLLTHSHSTSTTANISSNAFTTNGYRDRTEIGQIHQQNNTTLSGVRNNSLDIEKDLLPDCFDNALGTTSTNGHHSQNFSSSLSDIVIEPYSSDSNPSATSNLSIEEHVNYGLFAQYVDYNEAGVTVVEEPIEKKRKKWTAQEILSKCQSNNVNNLTPTTANNNISDELKTK